MRILAAIAGLQLLGCSDKPAPPPPPPEPPVRRVIEPPPGTVLPLPPHAIRADGVGPYRLGERLDRVLDELPSGPRVALFDIPNLVHRSLIRAEDDTVLIGGEPTSTASSVAVVGAEVARTESGVHVGSSKDELVRALGPLVDDVETARDPRLIVPSTFKNLHAILDDGGRVIALVVTAEPARATEEPSNPCVRPPPPSKGFSACLSATGELVQWEGDEISVSAPDDHPIAKVTVSGLVFAASLRAETRDELIAVTRVDDVQQRTWFLVAYRLEGGKLVRTLDPQPIYQLAAANARWIGAEVRDVDLYLELTSRPDNYQVGGFLTTRAGDKLRDVVVISTVPVPRRHGKVLSLDVPVAADAGINEATDAQSRPRP